MDTSNRATVRLLGDLAATGVQRGRGDEFLAGFAQALGVPPPRLYGFCQGLLDPDVPIRREQALDAGDERELLGYAEGRTFAATLIRYQMRD